MIENIFSGAVAVIMTLLLALGILTSLMLLVYVGKEFVHMLFGKTL